MKNTNEISNLVITQEVIKRTDLSWTEKVLLAEIDRQSRHRLCTKTNRHFTKFLQVGERQLQKLLKRLKEKNCISRYTYNETRTLIVNTALSGLKQLA